MKPRGRGTGGDPGKGPPGLGPPGRFGLGAEAFIALRYLRSKRRSRLLSLISVLAVGGVGLGVAALIVVLAVLAGFETNLKEKLLGLQAHVTIYKPSSNIEGWREVVARIERVPGVSSAQPVATGQVMAASAEGATGVVLMGIDPELAGKADYFGPFNLTPHGLDNLTVRPMVSPYPSPPPGGFFDEGELSGYELEPLELPDPLGPEWNPEPLASEGSPEPLASEGSPEPFGPEGALEPLASEGSLEPLEPLGPEGAPEPIASAGATEPLMSEGSLEPFVSAGATEPLAPEGSPEPLAPEGSPEPLAPEGSPEPIAPEGSPEPIAPEGSPEPFGLAGTPEPLGSEGALEPLGADVTLEPFGTEVTLEPFGTEVTLEPFGTEGPADPKEADGEPLKGDKGFAPVDGYADDGPLPDEPPPATERGIILGSELSLLVGQGALGEVNVISPFGRVTPIGRRLPLSGVFRVAGVFRTNLFDYDSRVAFVTIRDAQEFLGMDDTVSAIEIMTEDIYAAGEVRQRVLAALGPEYWGRDWMQMNMSLFSALKLEQAAMFVILTLIILVAAFNIASTLVMMVTEKTRDIAILKAMGATGGQIRRIFTIQGLAVGGAGTLGGLAVGVALCLLLSRYEFISLPPEVYLMSTLPVEMRPLQVAAITLVSLLISWLATLYPSSQAASMDPVEAIRYE